MKPDSLSKRRTSTVNLYCQYEGSAITRKDIVCVSAVSLHAVTNFLVLSSLLSELEITVLHCFI